MDKAEIAKEIRARQGANGRANTALLNNVSDDGILLSYITCTCCRDVQMSPQQLLHAIESAIDAETFLKSCRDRLDEHYASEPDVADKSTLLNLRSSERVQPRIPTKISGKHKYDFVPLGILVAGAGTANGERDWVVNDVEVDGVSRLSMKDLPGILFSTSNRAMEQATSDVFDGFGMIHCRSKVEVTVTYVGRNPEGAFFFGAIRGTPALGPT